MATTAKKAVPGKSATKAPTAKKTAAKRPAVKQPAAKPVASKQPKTAPAKVEKPKKPKLVRDSFTMPEDEYALIAKIKKNCVAAGFEIKKSELLRIGVSLLAGLDPKKLQSAQQSLPALKAGRPKKQK